jgi:two-component system repressor protein LuxO
VIALHDASKSKPAAGKRVLIVEDVLPLAIQYRVVAERLGAKAAIATSGADAALMLISEGPWHAAVVDLNLPDVSGFDVIATIGKEAPDCAVIVVTAEDAVDNAVRATEAGAFDFIQKPVTAERLSVTLRNALKTAQLSAEVETLRGNQRPSFHRFIGSSQAMQAVYRMIETVARSRAPVAITGESGTGKELAAEAIHLSSARADKPFVAINCAAIPKDLIESELFGHVKGAFTGATADRPGAFAQADGGTLFLDEIAEMEIGTQAKLLRVLQTGEIRRLGDVRERRVDVRLVCATHRDLYARVQQGLFREDLYYRLYVVPIELPPLRERGEDVIEIAEAMLRRYASEDGKRFSSIDEAARERLRRHDWPGNVRELINVIRAAVAMYDGEVLTAAMLPGLGRHARSNALGDTRPPVVDAVAQPAPSIPTGVRMPAAQAFVPRTLEQIEREAIMETLQACSGNMTAAARILGVNASTLYRKLARWDGLERPQKANPHRHGTVIE